MSENGSEKDVVVVGIPLSKTEDDDAKKASVNSNDATEELVKAADAARDTLQERVDAARLALDQREAKLKEREIALQKAIDELELEKKLMAGGTREEVVKVNVGGTTIMVKRSTLCQCKSSLLAAHFSGRWDDNVDMVGDAFFIDQDPKLFLGLVNFLRAKAIENAEQANPATISESLATSPDFKRLVSFYGMSCYVNTFTWEVPNFSKAEKDKKLSSRTFVIGGLKWQLDLYPINRSTDNEDEKDKKDYLGIYLKAVETGFPRTATYTLTIQGTKENAPIQSTHHIFPAKDHGYGWSKFITREEVLDSKAGFLVNDTLTIKAEIEVHSSG